MAEACEKPPKQGLTVCTVTADEEPNDFKVSPKRRKIAQSGHPDYLSHTHSDHYRCAAATAISLPVRPDSSI